MRNRSVLIVIAALCMVLAPTALLQAAAGTAGIPVIAESTQSATPDEAAFRSLPATRAGVAVTLARVMAGSDEAVPDGPIRPSFTDVGTDHWAFKYIEYVKANRIMSGYPDGCMRPNETLNRGQVAVIIARLLESGEESIPDGPAAPTFADVPSDSPWYRSVEYLHARGIISGFEDGMYHPEYSCTRGDLQVLIDRALGTEDYSVAMIGSSRQLAVRNECWYALDPNWLYKPNDSYGPPGITRAGVSGCSRWHYISTDGNNNGLRYVLRTYGGYVSDLIPGIGGTLTPSQIEYYIGRLTNDSYAMNYSAAPNPITGVGHGAQCVSFVSMILYRALGGKPLLNGQTFVWKWSLINPASYRSATYAQPGDLVFYKTGTYTGHVAVCVRNYGSGITVVDSNYVGHEVIARHNVTNAKIGTLWKTYSGRGRWY